MQQNSEPKSFAYGQAQQAATGTHHHDVQCAQAGKASFAICNTGRAVSKRYSTYKQLAKQQTHVVSQQTLQQQESNEDTSEEHIV